MTAPHDYPKRILLAVSGLSPQILTETFYALAMARSRPFVPTEIHLITTDEVGGGLVVLRRADVLQRFAVGTPNDMNPFCVESDAVQAVVAAEPVKMGAGAMQQRQPGAEPDRRYAETFLAAYQRVAGPMRDTDKSADALRRGMEAGFFMEKVSRVNRLLTDALGALFLRCSKTCLFAKDKPASCQQIQGVAEHVC